MEGTTSFTTRIEQVEEKLEVADKRIDEFQKELLVALKNNASEAVMTISKQIDRLEEDKKFLRLEKQKLEAKQESSDSSVSSSLRRDHLRDQARETFDNWAKCVSTERLIQAIDQCIQQSAEKLDALVSSNLLPARPYVYQHPGFKETLYEANIDGTSVPNLLIHELNMATKSVMTQRNHKIRILRKRVLESYVSAMIGPSGCGKTRTIFEYLAAHFGMFITASSASNEGSKDLEHLLFQVKTLPPLIRSIQLFYGFQSIVAIRLIFLQRLKLKYGERLSPYHWLMIQIMPTELFDHDVFHKLSRDFKIHTDGIERVQDRMPVFLDEVQAVTYSTDSSSMMCCSGSNIVALEDELRDKPDLENSIKHQELNVSLIPINRNLVSPILHSFTRLVDKKLTFVIAGTGLQFDEFNESVSSQVAKRVLLGPSYIKLGNFMEFDQFKRYISHYLPNLNKKQLKKIHDRVRGRYRFTACFISFYLHNRDVKMALERTSAYVVDSILRVLVQKFCQENVFLEKLECLTEMIHDHIKSVDDRTDNAWLIEMGLGLTKPQSDKVEIILLYQEVLRSTKIVEPLVFRVIECITRVYLLNTGKYTKRQ